MAKYSLLGKLVTTPALLAVPFLNLLGETPIHIYEDFASGPRIFEAVLFHEGRDALVSVD